MPVMAGACGQEGATCLRSIPIYDLYGELGAGFGADLLHCETLAARSRRPASSFARTGMPRFSSCFTRGRDR